MRFTVTTEGANRLGLAEVCQRFADDQLSPPHATPEEAVETELADPPQQA